MFAWVACFLKSFIYFISSRRSEWLHHCKRAARTLSRADFEPLKTVGKGQWGKVFLVRKTSGPVAGRAAADPGLVTGMDNVSTSHLSVRRWVSHKCNATCLWMSKLTDGRHCVLRVHTSPALSRVWSPSRMCVVNVRKVELLALKEVQLGSNTNISHVQNERLIMQAVPPHQFVVGMLYAFRTPRLVVAHTHSVGLHPKVVRRATGAVGRGL